MKFSHRRRCYVPVSSHTKTQTPQHGATSMSLLDGVRGLFLGLAPFSSSWLRIFEVLVEQKLTWLVYPSSLLKSKNIISFSGLNTTKKGVISSTNATAIMLVTSPLCFQPEEKNPIACSREFSG